MEWWQRVPPIAYLANLITKQGAVIMATLADIQSAVADLATANSALDDEVENTVIPLLQQLAAGTPVDPAAAQAVVDSLTAAKALATTAHDDLVATVTAVTQTPPTP